MARDEDAGSLAKAAPPRSGTERAGLVVEGLRKSYKRRPVVRDVSLSVRRGEAVGLLGPNGAGKTTVFYMITGLIAAVKIAETQTPRDGDKPPAAICSDTDPKTRLGEGDRRRVLAHCVNILSSKEETQWV